MTLAVVVACLASAATARADVTAPGGAEAMPLPERRADPPPLKADTRESLCLIIESAATSHALRSSFSRG